MIKLKGHSQETPKQAPALSEERQLRINPEVDARLTAFMEANSKQTEYYRQLVQQQPDRAVRSLMLNRMFKHEDQMRLVERQMPMVKQWVEQTPGMLESISARIAKINPFYREKAFVREAMRQKARIDFTPASTSVKIST